MPALGKIVSVVGNITEPSTARLVFTLGHCTGQTFNPGVSKGQFDRIQSKLNTNQNWTRVEVNAFSEEEWIQGTKTRCIRVPGGPPIYETIADRVELASIPLDVLFTSGVTTSTPPIRLLPPLYPKRKTLTYFDHKVWRFALSSVQMPRGSGEDRDDDRTFRYEVSIHLLDSSAIQSRGPRYVAEYGIQLCKDLLAMLAPDKQRPELTVKTGHVHPLFA